MKQSGRVIAALLVILLGLCGGWYLWGGNKQAKSSANASNGGVHVVSVYEARMPNGESRGFGNHPQGSIELVVNDSNATLVLLSYEPIEWRINTNGKPLKRVIASGYYEQRVTLAEGGDAEITIMPTSQLRTVTGVNEIPRGRDTNDLVGIDAIARALTGKSPNTYQSNYAATRFEIGSNFSPFAFPTQQRPAPSNSPAKLVSDLGTIQGNLFSRGIAGAYTDAWADHAYSAGKVYFEGTVRVSGSLGVDSFANIGLCLARDKTISSSPDSKTLAIRFSEEGRFQNGDVFGIAADLDRQRLYYRVNDIWLTGAPDSTGGVPLENGRSYRACLFAAGMSPAENPGNGVHSNTGWEFNLGAQPFNMPLPTGFVPYQG